MITITNLALYSVIELDFLAAFARCPVSPLILHHFTLQ